MEVAILIVVSLILLLEIANFVRGLIFAAQMKALFDPLAAASKDLNRYADRVLKDYDEELKKTRVSVR